MHLGMGVALSFLWPFLQVSRFTDVARSEICLLHIGGVHALLGALGVPGLAGTALIGFLISA